MSKVSLQSYCPPSCVCGSKKIKKWHHASCMTQAYISNKGDVSCAEGCAEYFIQHACFKCEQNNEYEQYKSATQFFVALAQAMQSAEFTLSDEQKVQFITIINQQVLSRWSY